MQKDIKCLLLPAAKIFPLSGMFTENIAEI